jgi:competence protein ComEA
MRRAFAPDHEAAVARRLELLSAELDTVRGESPRPRLRVAGPVEPAEREEATDADVAVLGSELGVEHWRPGGVTRVRAPGSGELSPPMPVLPRLPGRHASRRSLPWSSLVPEPLHGRWSLGPGQVAVLAVGAAVGLALTCWWLVRSGGHDVPVPAALPAAASALVTPSGGIDPAGASGVGTTVGPSVPGGSSAGPGAGPRIVVDVTGRVRRPGIVVLRSGSRVIDALRAAGGARRRTPLASLNLARVLTDGEQIVVGSPQRAVASGVGPSLSGSPVVGLVDLNTADETALESLPEIGPVTARAILAWRTEHGGFTAVSQLLDVDGIGDATLAKLTPYVTI